MGECQMAIASQRYTSLNKDTNVALSDFNTNGDTVTNKVGSSGNTVPTSKIEKNIGIATNSGITDVKGSSLPGSLANITKPNIVLDTLANDLSTVNGITNTLSGKNTTSLYNSTLKNYRRFGGSTSPSVLRNRVKKGVSFGKFLEEECKGDIMNLLNAFNRLGINLQAPLDPEALLAMMLGLLARLICNDITNSFSSLLGTITGVDLKNQFGAKSIGLAAVLQDPSLVTEVAGSTVGSSLLGIVPGITGVALTSIAGYSGANSKGMDKFFRTFDGALTTLDPSWKGVNGSNAGVHQNGNNLGGLAVRTLSNGVATNADVNSAIGLKYAQN